MLTHTIVFIVGLIVGVVGVDLATAAGQSEQRPDNDEDIRGRMGK